MPQNLWIEEKSNENLKQGYRVKKVLFSGQSPFQKVEIVETYGHGKMLLNDGLVMTSQRDESIYHEMISHPALFCLPQASKVLIIGGGDGGTAREVLRHSHIRECIMVEIDEMVVEASREFLPETSCSFQDPRFKLIIDDGVKYLKNCQEVFDLIIIDSTDPIGPATPLFNESFYQDVKRCLKDEGIVIAQGESPFYEVPMQRKLLSIIHELFNISCIYNFHNLTYPGGLWSFAYGSQRIHPQDHFEAKRVEDSQLDFHYYNSDTHRASFMLPEFMKKNLGEFLS